MQYNFKSPGRFTVFPFPEATLLVSFSRAAKSAVRGSLSGWRVDSPRDLRGDSLCGCPRRRLAFTLNRNARLSNLAQFREPYSLVEYSLI